MATTTTEGGSRIAGSPLLNAKHEQFAQFVARGEMPANAYVLCGYSEHGAVQSSNRLRRKPDVAARIKELQAAVAQRRAAKIAVDRDWVRAMLIQNVERAMEVKPVLDRKGDATGRYTYQGAAANKALALLGKHLGMFQPDHAAENERSAAGIMAAITSGHERVARAREEYRKQDPKFNEECRIADEVDVEMAREAAGSQDGSAAQSPPNETSATMPKPMPRHANSVAGLPLNNSKHEHFAQLIVRGQTAAKAYVLCGYRGTGAMQSGYRLLRRPDVAARVEALRTAAAERQVENIAVDRSWVVAKLTENVQRALQVEPVRDRRGHPIGQYPYRGDVANKALELLGQELGAFQAEKSDRGAAQIAALTAGSTRARERQARIREKMSRSNPEVHRGDEAIAKAAAITDAEDASVGGDCSATIGDDQTGPAIGESVQGRIGAESEAPKRTETGEATQSAGQELGPGTDQKREEPVADQPSAPPPTLPRLDRMADEVARLRKPLGRLRDALSEPAFLDPSWQPSKDAA